MNKEEESSNYIADDFDDSAKPSAEKDMEVYTETLHKTAQKTRKTLPKPTRYERARIIGVRTTQIAHGSEPLTDIGDLTDPYEMAVKEFEDGKTPLIIQRKLPGGEVENVRVSELI